MTDPTDAQLDPTDPEARARFVADLVDAVIGLLDDRIAAHVNLDVPSNVAGSRIDSIQCDVIRSVAETLRLEV